MSIWEEDFSEVKRYIDNLKKRGVSNFREYFARHPEDVLSLARKVKTLAVNDATLKMYQAENEEEPHRGLNFIFNKESYDVFREELIALSEGHTEFFSEAVNLTLRGEERHILLKLVVLPGYETTLSHIFVYIIDISDLKRMETKLIESEEKYRKIVNAAHDAIMVADTESGIVLEANKKAEELLGIPANNIVGMHFTQLHPPEESARYKKLFEHHMKKGDFISENLIVCHKCGDRIPVSISSSILELDGKKCIAAIFRQIHEESKDKEDMKRSGKPARGLSERECEIMRSIAAGLSAREIAEKLYVSEKTVKTHRSRIMKKLNMHKSIDLVRYAMSCGLADEDPSV